ncbi:MAG: hypothetical protein WCI18_14210 [Pseudomonadota bacterium]
MNQAPLESFQYWRSLSDERLKALVVQLGQEASTVRQVVKRVKELWDIKLVGIEKRYASNQSRTRSTRQALLDQAYMDSVKEYSDLLHQSLTKRIQYETSMMLITARRSERLHKKREQLKY